MSSAAASTVLSVRDLKVGINTDEGYAEILDNVSLRVARREILGVVGESGCGKSTLVKAILGVLSSAAVVENGSVTFDGIDLLTLGERELTRRIRGRRIGFIPQDPFLALNPVFTVGTQFLELMKWHAAEADPASGNGGTGRSRQNRRHHRERLSELLRAVQIPDPAASLRRYPHEFSGGQRQRLLIAAALACRPTLLIADEPTSALDVTTQQEILLLLKRLAREFDFSVLFITHDFGVVAQLCDVVSVMYLGQTIESGRVEAILNQPRHPYTQMLIACHPDRAKELEGIPGTVPSPIDPPSGCRFHTRCPSAKPACAERRPAVRTFEDGHAVNCVLFDGHGPAR